MDLVLLTALAAILAMLAALALGVGVGLLSGRCRQHCGHWFGNRAIPTPTFTCAHCERPFESLDSFSDHPPCYSQDPRQTDDAG